MGAGVGDLGHDLGLVMRADIDCWNGGVADNLVEARPLGLGPDVARRQGTEWVGGCGEELIRHSGKRQRPGAGERAMTSGAVCRVTSAFFKERTGGNHDDAWSEGFHVVIIYCPSIL